MKKQNLQDKIVESIENQDYTYTLEALFHYSQKYGNDLFYYISLSDVLLAEEEYEDVVSLMDDALFNDFDDALIYERKGDAYLGLKEYDKAIESYKKCDIDVDSYDNLHILYMIGYCHKEKKEYKQAINYFEDVLLDLPDDEKVLIDCALCYINIKEYNRGYEYLNKILDQNPDTIYHICNELIFQDNESLFINYVSQIENTMAQYDLLYSFYLLHENKEKAILYAKKIKGKDPELSNISTLADTYDHFGEYEMASHVYNEIANMPDDDTSPLFMSIEAHLEAFDYLYLSYDIYKDYVEKHLIDAQTNLTIFNLLAQFSCKHKNWNEMSKLAKMDKPDDDSVSDMDINMYYSILFSYYIQTSQYKEGLQFLKEKVPVDYEYYDKTKVMLDFYLEQYNDVIAEYDDAMPDGLVAFMAFMSLYEVGKIKEAHILIEEFLAFAISNPDIDDIDIFVELMKDYVDEIGD